MRYRFNTARISSWVFSAILLATTGPAAAHAFLEHSSPGAGQVLATSPRILTLDFTEPLEAAFCDVTVSDPSGRAVTTDPDTVQGTRMSVVLPPLKPGTYTVTWHALSIDTHRTQGSFRFTVRP